MGESLFRDGIEKNVFLGAQGEYFAMQSGSSFAMQSVVVKRGSKIVEFLALADDLLPARFASLHSSSSQAASLT
jgi:hypothetical protein